MRSTAGRKPRSSMRSASSSTSSETESRRTQAPLDQILEAAGRGHQDVRARGLLGLAVDADAAEGGGDAQAAGARERRRLVGDLHGELARRHQHEAGGNRGVTRDALDHGDREGDRLAAARGRLGEDVASGQGVRKDELLDGEGFRDAALRERSADVLGRAKGAKGLRTQCSTPGRMRPVRGLRNRRAPRTDQEERRATSRSGNFRSGTQHSSGRRDIPCIHPRARTIAGAMTVIDINIDAGESYGAWTMGDDAGTFPYATSVNLACGFHGGDPASMFAAARLALEHGLAIGAHPGLPDLVGFGRRALHGHARAGLRRRRLPGGCAQRRARRARRDAASRQAARRVLDARAPRIPPSPTACCAPCTTSIPRCRWSSTPGSQLARAADAIGHPQRARGLPRARLRAGRPARAARHARAPSSPTWTRPPAARCAWRSRARSRRSTARRSSLRPRTLCVHGDNPHAARIAAAVRAALEAAGVELAAF